MKNTPDLISTIFAAVLDGTVTFHKNTWRVGGKTVPWNLRAKKEWATPGLLIFAALNDLVERVEKMVADTRHWLSWHERNICDGCTALHMMDGRHIPHMEDGVDLGLHHFHVSTSEYTSMQKALTGLVEKVAAAKDRRRGFLQGIAEKHHMPLDLFEGLGEEVQVMVVNILLELEKECPMASRAIPLTRPYLEDAIQKWEGRILYHEKNLETPNGWVKPQESQEELPGMRARLRACQWLLTHPSLPEKHDEG